MLRKAVVNSSPDILPNDVIDALKAMPDNRIGFCALEEQLPGRAALLRLLWQMKKRGQIVYNDDWNQIESLVIKLPSQ